ncbi:MAG: DNA internalization-related competence protein ComEC/Rec2 [Lachnospiraceae bacterium]|nr:DNA internalization-related competence protein ComEC/Rec2 [Lachnospiraceae bacterium]
MTIILITFSRGVPESRVQYGEEIHLRGKVVGKNTDSQVLILDNITFCDDRDSNEEKVNKVECTIAYGELPALGSYVEICGKAKPYSRATNPGAFDYHTYKASMGLSFAMGECQLVDVVTDNSSMVETIWRLKMHCRSNIAKVYPEKEAGIIDAMLLGEKGTLDEEVKNLFQDGGISHILAISGLHISFLGMGLFKLLKKLTLPNSVAVPLVSMVIIVYCILCGASASSVRATVMLLFVMVAKLIKKNNDPLTALLLAATMLVLHEPYVVYNAGFWMSFFAVLGFMGVIPVFTDRLQERFGKRWKGRIVIAVVSSILFGLYSLPMVLYFYYVYSPYSMLLNLLVIPLMSFLLPLAVLSMALGGFCLPLAKVFSMPVRWILYVYEKACDISLKLPGSRLCFGKPALWKLLFFYGMLILLYLLRKRLREVMKYVVLAAVLLVVCMHPRNGVKVTFLDVGQGDGICISTKEAVMMIDGGSTSNQKLAKYQLIPFLEAQGITHIDTWFVTHPDADHMSGLCSILDEEWENCRLRIDKIILPNTNGIEQEAEELLALANRRQIPVYLLKDGEGIGAKNWQMICVNPVFEEYYADVNAASLVLWFSAGKQEDETFDLLFTGDATKETEAVLMQSPLFMKLCEEHSLEILKVGHHGSKYSSEEGFLRMVSPEVSIISVGARNRYGHPHPEVLYKLAVVGTQVYRTDEKGAITAAWKHGQMKVYPFLNH